MSVILPLVSNDISKNTFFEQNQITKTGIYKDKRFVSERVDDVVKKVGLLIEQFPELIKFIETKWTQLSPKKYRSVEQVKNENQKVKINILYSPESKERLNSDKIESIYIFKLMDQWNGVVRQSKYVGKVGNEKKQSSRGRSVAKRTEEHIAGQKSTYFDRFVSNLSEKCDTTNSDENIQIGIVPDELTKELKGIGLNLNQIEFLVTAGQVLKARVVVAGDKENVSEMNVINTQIPSIRSKKTLFPK